MFVLCMVCSTGAMKAGGASASPTRVRCGPLHASLNRALRCTPHCMLSQITPWLGTSGHFSSLAQASGAFSVLNTFVPPALSIKLLDTTPVVLKYCQRSGGALLQYLAVHALSTNIPARSVTCMLPCALVAAAVAEVFCYTVAPRLHCAAIKVHSAMFLCWRIKGSSVAHHELVHVVQ